MQARGRQCRRRLLLPCQINPRPCAAAVPKARPCRRAHRPCGGGAYRQFQYPMHRPPGLPLMHQAGQHIDAEAHIARFDNARMARRRGDLRFLVCIKSGRADNMNKRAWAANAASSTLAAGVVKSMIPSAWRISASASWLASGQVFTARQHAQIFAQRSAVGASNPPASVTPSCSSISLISVRPMRPAQPFTINLMAIIAGFAPLLYCFASAFWRVR